MESGRLVRNHWKYFYLLGHQDVAALVVGLHVGWLIIDWRPEEGQYYRGYPGVVPHQDPGAVLGMKCLETKNVVINLQNVSRGKTILILPYIAWYKLCSSTSLPTVLCSFNAIFKNLQNWIIIYTKGVLFINCHWVMFSLYSVVSVTNKFSLLDPLGVFSLSLCIVMIRNRFFVNNSGNPEPIRAKFYTVTGAHMRHLLVLVC